MKIYYVIFITGLLLISCSSAKKSEISTSNVVLGPQVKNFLDNSGNKSDDKLSVTVRTKEAVNDIPYLHKINETYYTAKVTKKQLEDLLSDKRVEKISSSMKKPLK